MAHSYMRFKVTPFFNEYMNKILKVLVWLKVCEHTVLPLKIVLFHTLHWSTFTSTTVLLNLKPVCSCVVSIGNGLNCRMTSDENALSMFNSCIESLA